MNVGAVGLVVVELFQANGQVGCHPLGGGHMASRWATGSSWFASRASCRVPSQYQAPQGINTAAAVNAIAQPVVEPAVMLPPA